MKYIFFLLTAFVSLNAECLNPTTFWGSSTNLNGYSSATDISYFPKVSPAADLDHCKQLYDGKIMDLISTPSQPIIATDITTPSNGTNYYCGGKMYYTAPKTCPSGQIVDQGTCQCTCDWATQPPWIATGLTQAYCSNVNKLPTNDNSGTKFLWNFEWCDISSTCYGREMNCNKGERFDATEDKCYLPSAPGPLGCPSGWYKQSLSSTSIINGQSVTACYTDFICKDDPKFRKRIEVSCNGGVSDPNFPITNVSAPTTSEDISGSYTPSSDNTSKCLAEKTHAQTFCWSPKVLSFECDPKTGTVIKSICADPNTAAQKTIDPSDLTTAATTADIKSLSNDLPQAIKDSLKDYFTDGSMSHLEGIRGSLDASVILQADANDKLSSVIASNDASLVLQADTNTKLDEIKTSVDDSKSFLSNISDFFTDGSTYSGETMPTSADLAPDAEITSGYDTFTNGFTQITSQFDNAKTVLSGNLPSVTFGSGSCPSYTFYGQPVTISKIGDSIAPYASIFSVLIYISLMIQLFRMVFSFFSRGI